jgi:drug/metabolite transporter (DMT)-like permease
LRVTSIAALLLVGAIWGSEWLVTRGLDSPPLAAMALRYAIAACLLGLIALVRGIRLPGPRSAVVSAVTGISFLAAPALLIGWASGRLSPGLLVVILSMTPLLAALMERRASGGLLAPLIGGVAGTALLASQGLSFALTQWAGAIAMLAAAAMIAASIVWTKRELAEAPVILSAAIQLASSAMVVALWSIIAEGRSGLAVNWSLLRAEALLAIAGSAIALPLYYWALRELESFEMTAAQWTVTVAGVGEGLLLVREAPGWRLMVGAAILFVSLGALLGTRSGREEPVTLALTGVSPR